jgi:hypothetical protein
MVKGPAAIAIALFFLAQPAHGQDYCEQVKQAVATYGHKAARQHALLHYGKEAVAEADKCLPARATASPKRARSKSRANRS